MMPCCFSVASFVNSSAIDICLAMVLEDCAATAFLGPSIPSLIIVKSCSPLSLDKASICQSSPRPQAISSLFLLIRLISLSLGALIRIVDEKIPFSSLTLVMLSYGISSIFSRIPSIVGFLIITRLSVAKTMLGVANAEPPGLILDCFAL
jgi:hypothetical protein